jgi:small-conductance mechanosensitive channel
MNESNSFYSSVNDALANIFNGFIEFAPSIVAAILLIVLGYIVAKIVKKSLNVILKRIGLNTLSDSTGINEQLSRFGDNVTLNDVLANTIYWIIFLLFFAAAINTLGLTQLTLAINGFVAFLPKLISAMLVLVFGISAANFAKNFIFKSCQSMGFDFAKPVSKVVYGILLLLVLSLTISQLEFETELLNTMISIALAAIGIGAAISIGLGSKSTSENIMYSLYVGEILSIGDSVTLKNGTSGIVDSIGAIATLIRLENNALVAIKNNQILDELTIHQPTH